MLAHLTQVLADISLYAPFYFTGFPCPKTERAQTDQVHHALRTTSRDEFENKGFPVLLVVAHKRDPTHE